LRIRKTAAIRIAAERTAAGNGEPRAEAVHGP
jgi:hypothetical protein